MSKKEQPRGEQVLRAQSLQGLSLGEFIWPFADNKDEGDDAQWKMTQLSSAAQVVAAPPLRRLSPRLGRAVLLPVTFL